MSVVLLTEKEAVEIAQKSALMALEKAKEIAKSAPEVMTLAECAAYFRVSKQSIINWTRDKSNPFPVDYFGSEPRFFLYEVRVWSRNNAERKLSEKTS